MEYLINIYLEYYWCTTCFITIPSAILGLILSVCTKIDLDLNKEEMAGFFLSSITPAFGYLIQLALWGYFIYKYNKQYPEHLIYAIYFLPVIMLGFLWVM